MILFCTCCQEESVTFLYTKNGFDIYKCNCCGLGITYIPKDFDLLSIYNEDYFQGNQVDGYVDYIGSETVLRREFRRDVDLLMSYIDNKNKKLNLLEIGSAYGFFLEEAKEYFNVQGIEVAKEAVDFCRKRGLNVMEGILTEDNCSQMSSFDIVVFLDVIEHIPNPDEFFGYLNRITHSGSKLLLTTGDFGSLFSRFTRKNWRLMTPPQHVYFYSRKSLFKLLERYGYKVEIIFAPSKIVPLDLVFFQLARIMRLKMKPPRFLKGRELKVNLFDSIKIIASRI